MSIYIDKGMMHAKWHCTLSVNNGVMALCIYSVSMQLVGVYVESVTKLYFCRGYQFNKFACCMQFSQIDLWKFCLEENK